MRKLVLSVLIGLLVVMATSVVIAQGWVTIPVGVLTFDGSDGQELGHLDSIANYVNASSCIRLAVTMNNIVPAEDNPELMYTLNQGDARFGFNVYKLEPKQTGVWIFQFPVSAMRLVGADLGDLKSTSSPDESLAFDYGVIRGWGGVKAEINSVQSSKGNGCAVSSSLLKPVTVVEPTAVETPFATLPLTAESELHWCKSLNSATSTGSELTVTFEMGFELTNVNAIVLFVDGADVAQIRPVWRGGNSFKVGDKFLKAHPTAVYARNWLLQYWGSC